MTAQTIIEATRKAIKDFGVEPFYDKGPQEVMDIAGIADELRKMSASEAGKVILEVSRTQELENDRGLRVAEVLVSTLDDWDELFDDPDIGELY